MTQAALLLKAPREGEVKTRLARSIGPELATKIYRALVERQLAQVPTAWQIVIHFAPSEAEAEMRSWLDRFASDRADAGLPNYDFVPQPKGDLGARLISAMNRGFASGADLLFFLGGDCPGLTTSYLQQAEAALAQTDMIIGPARDGGYVLLGLRKPVTSIFQEIRWSSESVFTSTLQKAMAAGLSVHCLPMLEDVDNLESYERQRDMLENLANE